MNKIRLNKIWVRDGRKLGTQRIVTGVVAAGEQYGTVRVRVLASGLAHFAPSSRPGWGADQCPRSTFHAKPNPAPLRHYVRSVSTEFPGYVSDAVSAGFLRAGGSIGIWPLPSAAWEVMSSRASSTHGRPQQNATTAETPNQVPYGMIPGVWGIVLRPYFLKP
jgi:hypothetical protein